MSLLLCRSLLQFSETFDCVDPPQKLLYLFFIFVITFPRMFGTGEDYRFKEQLSLSALVLDAARISIDDPQQPAEHYVIWTEIVPNHMLVRRVPIPLFRVVLPICVRPLLLRKLGFACAGGTIEPINFRFLCSFSSHVFEQQFTRT